MKQAVPLSKLETITHAVGAAKSAVDRADERKKWARTKQKEAQARFREISATCETPIYRLRSLSKISRVEAKNAFHRAQYANRQDGYVSEERELRQQGKRLRKALKTARKQQHRYIAAVHEAYDAYRRASHIVAQTSDACSNAALHYSACLAEQEILRGRERRICAERVEIVRRVHSSYTPIDITTLRPAS